jgi:hypothetical protein
MGARVGGSRLAAAAAAHASRMMGIAGLHRRSSAGMSRGRQVWISTINTIISRFDPLTEPLCGLISWSIPYRCFNCVSST